MFMWKLIVEPFYLCVPVTALDMFFSALPTGSAASIWAQEYYHESVCSQPVNLLWNCIPVLKRGLAISALSVWISVPCGAMPSLRAPLLGIYSLAPDSLPLLTQWALCTDIYYCCGTLLRIFGNYTRFPLQPPLLLLLHCRKMQSKRGEMQWNGDPGIGLQELDCGADKFHIERVNMFLSCYPACTLTHGVWRRWRRV